MTLTRQTLENADDLIYVIVDELIRLVNAIPNADQVDFVRGLSPGLRMVWGVFMVDGEVNNGGFNQFFWNDSHRFVQEARDGLALIGADAQLKLLQTATERFDAEQKRWRPYREENTLEAFSESYSLDLFADLDNQYFMLDTYTLQEAYIRAHIEEFVTAGNI